MKKLYLCVLVFCLGVVAYYVCLCFLNTTSIGQLVITNVAKVTDLAQSGLQNIQQNLVGYLAMGGGIFSGLTVLYNNVYKKAKEHIEQVGKNELTAVKTELTQQNVDLKTENLALKQQLDNIPDTTSLQTQVTSLTTENSKLQKQQADLNIRLEEAQQLVNVMHAPSESDLVHALENKGYAITKKVR